MSKIRYKATKINKVNLAKLKARIAGQALVFSIDVAQHGMVGLLSVTGSNEAVQLVSWQHPTQMKELIAFLQALEAESIVVVMEPTGTYGEPLRYQFEQHGITVYRVQPKHTYDQAETFDGVPSSHDSKACFIIADLHHRGRSQLWERESAQQKTWKSWLSALDIYQAEHQADLNRLHALLAQYWPEFELNANLDTLSSLHLLATYSTPANVADNATAAAELLKTASRSQLKEPKRQAIIASAQTTCAEPVPEGTRQLIQLLARKLLDSHATIKELETVISQSIEEKDDLAPMIAMCGKVTTLMLVAYLGHIGEYEHTQSLLKACGLNLKEHSSGKHKGRLSITKRGNSGVRFYLYWLAMRMVKNDPNVKAWYERKVARQGGKRKKCALVAVMRKLVKALWYVARGEPFDSSQLFAAAA